jgi:hypothetical protein
VRKEGVLSMPSRCMEIIANGVVKTFGQFSLVEVVAFNENS